jgi:hypothetical protein
MTGHPLDSLEDTQRIDEMAVALAVAVLLREASQYAQTDEPYAGQCLVTALKVQERHGIV